MRSSLLVLLGSAAAYPDSGDNGTAHASSIVLAPDGLARFSVLTARVVRMESVATRGDAFVDAPSLAFINRQLPTPAFANTPNATHCVVIKTSQVELAYVCAAAGGAPGNRSSAACTDGCAEQPATDIDGAKRSPTYPDGLNASSPAACCAACAADKKCTGFISAAAGSPRGKAGQNCWPMASWKATQRAPNRTLYTLPAAPGAGGFTAANLRAVVQLGGSGSGSGSGSGGGGGTASWAPGQAATGNLRGTISSWNEVPSAHSGNAMDFGALTSLGPLSRDGWAVLDDGASPLFENNTEVRLPPPATPGADVDAGSWPWAAPRQGSQAAEAAASSSSSSSSSTSSRTTTTTTTTTSGGGGGGGSSGGKAQGAAVDWYLFGCGGAVAGASYEACLGDLAALSGAIALPARSVLGVWWSHYEALSQDVFVNDVLAHYAADDIPLNHVVLDCDWHVRPVGQKYCGGFGGFTWNESLFPDHGAFVRDLQRGAGANNPVGRPIKIALNTHSFKGVDHCQAQYAAFARDIGFSTAEQKTVPLKVSDRAQMAPFFRDVLGSQQPLLDAWWVDGALKQWVPPIGTFSVAQNMAWFSYLHDSHGWLAGRAVAGAPAPARLRPLQLGPRYGGLGQQRAGVGFSGDAVVAWNTLRAEVNMTKTASNVLYGWWSHDIGGFIGTPTDELMLRWVQFGALSPILRTHGKKPSIRRPWDFPSFPLLRDAMRLRLCLVPYLYGAAADARDSGVAMLRPLHLRWPASYPQAYAGFGVPNGTSFGAFQYMIGDSIMAAPVVTPADPAAPDTPGPEGFVNATGAQTVRVWLPPPSADEQQQQQPGSEGRGWVEWNSSALVARPADGVLTLRGVGPADVPLFVLGGAVLPFAPVGTNDATARGAVAWAVFPRGSGLSGPVTGTLYDDDGASDAFLRGGCSRSSTTVLSDGARTTTVRVGRAVYASDSWDGAGLTARNTTLEMRGRGKGALIEFHVSCTVTATGAPCANEPSWRVPGGHSLARPEGTLVVDLGSLSIAHDVDVVLTW